MSSDNWNDIYRNGFGSPIDWDCCPVSSGVAIAMIHAKKVAMDIGRHVYISKRYVHAQGAEWYRITTGYSEGAFDVLIAIVYPGGRIEYRKDKDCEVVK